MRDKNVISNQATYGIIEGFFSTPLPVWTHAQRLQTIQFVSQACPGISNYLYCPKNDEYVTGKPYKLYPVGELESIYETITFCDLQNISYIYGLNPSLTEQDIHNPAQTIDKICHKLDQLYRVGCKSFCLLFDDIPAAYDVFESDLSVGERLIRDLVSIVNGVYEQMHNKTQDWYFCGPDYCMLNATALTLGLKNIHPEITIFRTGKYIFSPNITSQEYDTVHRNIGNKKVALRKNYPVNDLQQNVGMYNLSGYTPYQIEKTINLPIFINPMRECEMNYFHFKTFSEYIQNKTSYSPQLAMTNAVCALLDLTLEETNLFLSFAQADIYRDPKTTLLKVTESGTFIERLDALIAKLKDKGGVLSPAVDRYVRELVLFRNISEGMMNNQNIDTFLLEEVFPTFTKNPRYFLEILRIVQARSQLGYFSKAGLRTLKAFEAYATYYTEHYAGSKGLKKINEFKDRYLGLIDELIELDQRNFLDYCKNPQRDMKDKIHMYIIRRSINRFSLKMYN